MAVALDDPQRQPHPPQGGRDQDRRAPGLLGLDGVDPDGAVFHRAAAAGPGGGQAPCLADLPRHAVPDGQPVAREDGELPGLWRRPVLSLAHQGRGRRGFLDRLGRPGGGGHGLRLADPGLCGGQALGGGPAHGADDRADGRRRTGRGQHLRMPAGRLEARSAQLLVGDRLQPPVARRRRPRGPVEPDRGDLRRLRLGCRAREIRRPAARGLRRAGGRGAAALDRRLPEPALFGPDLPGRGGLARAADGRLGRPGRGVRPDRPAQRRGTRRADGEPGRQLRPDHGRSLRRDRPRPADLFPRLYGQGLGHPHRRAQGQPWRADDEGPDGRMAGPHGRARRA